MATQNPIQVSSGQAVVDTSIIPFIRKSDVEFSAVDLKPYKAANYFFDETNVTKLVQRSSLITSNSNTVVSLTQGEGLYNADSGAYATVVDVSPNNNIYLNENYYSFVISGVSLTSTTYKKGDIVYQNGTATASTDINTPNNTFVGRVEHWDSTTNTLVLSHRSGLYDLTTAPAFFKAGASVSNSFVSVLASSRFAADDLVVSVDNPTTSFGTGTYENHSGMVISGSGTTVVVSSSLASAFSGSGTTFKVTSGTGAGQERIIDTIVDNTITLTTALSSNLASDSRYTIGAHTVDAYGRLSGIFNIPEDKTLKFRTGERLFTITDASSYDDPDAQMKATARYVASGLMNQKQEIRFTPVVLKLPPPQPSAPTVTVVNQITNVTVNQIRVTPVTPVPTTPPRRRDPVAQTFFTPDPKSIKQNYGIFVSSVQIFFSAKPVAGTPQLPVTVRLVTTVNGYPTQTILGSATLYPDDVTVTSATDDYDTILSKSTKFSFADPVYLEPKTEYAIVVYSESPDYEVWISELGQKIVGTERRISEQPYAGSFFRSQNASTWTPFQNQDLMFIINKAVFSTAPAVAYFRAENPLANVFVDEMLLHTNDITFPDSSLRYLAKTTVASTLTADSEYFEVTPNKPYSFGADLKNSSKTQARRRLVQSGNGSTMNVKVIMSTNDPDVSPMFNDERFSLIATENLINNGSLSNTNITITNGGGYHTDNANISVIITAPQLSGGVTATAIVLQEQLVSGNITGMFITNPGSGYIENPTITITDVSPQLIGYANATAVVVSETSPYGGNSRARYVTRKITLADGFDAGDLRLFVRAVRPKGTQIIAYYKVLSDTDASEFTSKNWKKLEIVSENYSIDQNTEVELQYRPSLISGQLSYTENGIDYPLGGTFKNFAIKLVLLAEDTTVVPYVKNMRAIATPAG